MTYFWKVTRHSTSTEYKNKKVAALDLLGKWIHVSLSSKWIHLQEKNIPKYTFLFAYKSWFHLWYQPRERENCVRVKIFKSRCLLQWVGQIKKCFTAIKIWIYSFFRVAGMWCRQKTGFKAGTLLIGEVWRWGAGQKADPMGRHRSKERSAGEFTVACVRSHGR